MSNWFWDVLDTAVDKYKKYKPLVDVAGSAGKAYLDYKDAKRRNELEEAAYDDYMTAAADAGEEARAAIELNLTPMTISGVPKTKADVTDYKAATGIPAKDGGIMKLRKKYAEGMDEFEVEEMDEEVEIGPMASGKYTQEEIEAYNNYKYEMNEQKPGFPIMEIDEFLRFFYSQVKGKENKMMASAPSMEDSQNEAAMQLFNKPYNQLNEMELQMLQEEMSKYMATGGIAGLRKKYAYGPDVEDVEMMDEEFVGDNELKMEEGVQIGPMAGGGDRGWRAQMLAEEIAEEQYGKEFYDLSQELQFKVYSIALDMIDSGGEARGPEDPEQPPIYLPKPGEEPQGIMMAAKGGRIRRANGGIMDMGGLEKDYRFSGGFVPIGEYEKKDDVPARLSKNEFVFTADAVRAAGGGSINKGAQRMYDTMKNLEARPEAKRMTA
jgi:hypothetical protein